MTHWSEDVEKLDRVMWWIQVVGTLGVLFAIVAVVVVIAQGG